MSQTVKIDAAAQDAIAEIVGMPWEKDYFDNTHDKDSAHVATVTREGVSVRIYICDESLCSADLWSFEAEQIAGSERRQGFSEGSERMGEIANAATQL